MALTINKNTMFFSDIKKRKKLLSPKRKIGMQRRISQMKKNSSTLPSWLNQRTKKQVFQLHRENEVISCTLIVDAQGI